MGLFNLLSPGRVFRRWSAAVAAVAALAAALTAVLPRMMDLYAEKIGEFTRAASTEVRLIQEGRVATVTVLDQVDPRRGTYRDMYLNGVEEASTRLLAYPVVQAAGEFSRAGP